MHLHVFAIYLFFAMSFHYPCTEHHCEPVAHANRGLNRSHKLVTAHVKHCQLNSLLVVCLKVQFGDLADCSLDFSLSQWSRHHHVGLPVLV